VREADQYEQAAFDATGDTGADTDLGA